MASDSFSGGESWTVPAGVTAAQFEVHGGASETVDSGGSEGQRSANGGLVRATMSVSPGETFNFFSDGGGETDDSSIDGQPVPHQAFYSGNYMDVRRGGTALGDQILVAGGAGAPGYSYTSNLGNRQWYSQGGEGGANVGEDGGEGRFNTGNIGTGGTQSTGGSGGADGNTASSDGSRAQGGEGATNFNIDTGSTPDEFSAVAGYGGGGYYGGGGGGANCSQCAGGGGGGSNFVATGQGFTNISNLRGASTAGRFGKVDVVWATPVPTVSIDSLTETDEGEVTITASTSGSVYEAEGTWTVYRSTDGSQGSAVYQETTSSDLSYVDTEAPTGETVYYTAERENLASTESAQSSLKVTLETPTLTVTDADDTSVSLDCDDITNADQYEWFYATSSGTVEGDYTSFGTTVASDEVITGLTTSTTYYFRVKAANSGDASFDSRLSNEVSSQTGLPAGVLDTVEDTDQLELTLNWTKVDDNTTGEWEVWRRPI